MKHSTWQARLNINQSVSNLLRWTTRCFSCPSLWSRLSEPVCATVSAFRRERERYGCVAVCTPDQLHLSSKPWSLVTPCCETHCLRCGNRSGKRQKGLEDGVCETGGGRLRCARSSRYPGVSDMSRLWGFCEICFYSVFNSFPFHWRWRRDLSRRVVMKNVTFVEIEISKALKVFVRYIVCVVLACIFSFKWYRN